MERIKLLNILLVEENTKTIKQIKKILDSDQDQYKLYIKKSIKEAQRLLNEFIPDIVFARYKFKHGKGLELISSDYEDRKFPLVIIHDKSDSEIEHQVIKAGAIDYVIISNASVEAIPKIISRIIRIWEITVKQKYSEKKIFESEWKYQSLFIESKDAAFICTLDGKISELNPAGYELFEISNRDDIKKINFPLDLCIKKKQWEDLLIFLNEEGYVKDYKIIFYTLNKSKKIIGLITAGVLKNTQQIIIGFSGIIRDISQNVRDERELKRINEELRDTNRRLKQMQISLSRQDKLASIGQLAAGIAHELNNPLGFISSNFNTLKKYFNNLNNFLNFIEETCKKKKGSEIISIAEEKKEKKIEFIMEDCLEIFHESQEGINRMRSIVDNLRSFSRIDYENKFAAYDLNNAIHNTLVVAKNEIKYYAKILKKLNPIPLIKCRPDEINQVLLNIIVNAAQAIKSQERKEMGEIIIETYSDNHFVYCKITDDGPGIPEKNLHKIFDPFFTTKEVGKGTGLGLNISHDIIVNKHKGDLKVSSKVGYGTNFTIQLPIKISSKDETSTLDDEKISFPS